MNANELETENMISVNSRVFAVDSRRGGLCLIRIWLCPSLLSWTGIPICSVPAGELQRWTETLKRKGTSVQIGH